MNPPGTEDSAFYTFAIVDELLRTLVDKDVLSRPEIAAMMERMIVHLKGLNRQQAIRCVPLAEKNTLRDAR